MFNKLTDFSYKRSAMEALGFYIAYFILIVIGAGVLGGVVGAMVQNTDTAYDLGIRVGTIVAVISSITISFLILKGKNLSDNLGFLILALLSGAIAIFVGALGGLIPAAYLTTRPKGKKK
jgi:uncharacterized membrane protein